MKTLLSILFMTLIILSCGNRPLDNNSSVKLNDSTYFFYDNNEWKQLNDQTKIDSNGAEYLFIKQTAPLCTLRVAFINYKNLYASNNREPIKTNSKNECELYRTNCQDINKDLKNVYFDYEESSYKSYEILTIELKGKKVNINKSQIPWTVAAFNAYKDYYVLTLMIENALDSDKKSVEKIIKTQLDNIKQK